MTSKQATFETLRTVCLLCGLLVTIGLAGCCSGTPETARVGETVRGPHSCFEITVQPAEVTEAIHGVPAGDSGQRWVVVRYSLKNDGRGPYSPAMEFQIALQDQAGGRWETSSEGLGALLSADATSLDDPVQEVAVGAVVRQAAVFALPGDRARGEFELVFSKDGGTGKPATLTVTVPVLAGQ